jgi:hypothetical protein
MLIFIFTPKLEYLIVVEALQAQNVDASSQTNAILSTQPEAIHL